MPDDAYPLPERRDGVEEWHRRHERAALLRAQDLTWGEIADEIGVVESTAVSYTKLPGFEELVAHLEAIVREKRVEQSDLETLEVICEYKPQVLEALAETAVEDGDAYAAAQFLEAIGFTQRNAALAELAALEETGGSGGDIIVDAEVDS